MFCISDEASLLIAAVFGDCTWVDKVLPWVKYDFVLLAVYIYEIWVITWAGSLWVDGNFVIFLAESSNWRSWSSSFLAFLREVLRLSIRRTSLACSLSLLICLILFSTFTFNSFCWSGVSYIGLTPVLLPLGLLLTLPSAFSTSGFWGAASIGSPSLSTLMLLCWTSGCFL